MFEIVLNTIRDRKYSITGFCLVCVFLIFLYASVFPTIHAQAASYEKLLATMPKGVLKAFGISGIGLQTFGGYISAEYLSFLWPLIMVFFTITGSVQGIAGEIENRTLAILLAFPLSRTHIFISKYVALLTQLAIFITVSILGIIPIATLLNLTYSRRDVVFLALAAGLFALAISSLGFFLSSLFSTKGIAMSIAYIIVLGMYAANVIAALADKFDNVKYISFFYYFNPASIMNGNNLQDGALLVFGGTTVVCFLLGLLVFIKRDITI